MTQKYPFPFGWGILRLLGSFSIGLLFRMGLFGLQAIFDSTLFWTCCLAYLLLKEGTAEQVIKLSNDQFLILQLRTGFLTRKLQKPCRIDLRWIFLNKSQFLLLSQYL